MTGDGSAIGSKFGISFTGKWVWGLKDYIDRIFMKLFDPNYLFIDYKTKGCTYPSDKNELFDEETSRLEYTIGHIRKKVACMSPIEAGIILSCGQEETEFHERFMILTRMHFDRAFTEQVVANFQPPY
jgi:hypothetical protein